MNALLPIEATLIPPTNTGATATVPKMHRVQTRIKTEISLRNEESEQPVLFFFNTETTS